MQPLTFLLALPRQTRTLGLALTIALTALAAAPLAGQTTTDAAIHAEVAGRLQEAVDGAPNGAVVALYVENAADNTLVFAHNPAEPMIPASNQKILSTAVALDSLGSDFRFRTDLRRNGPIADGVLQGDLIVVGMGDPTISGRYAPNRADPTSIFREWAKRLKQMGVQSIAGRVIGDDRMFDAQGAAPGWPENVGAKWYCADISALVFNDGYIDVTWRGGRTASDAPTYTLSPPTAYLQLVSRLQSNASQQGARHYVWSRDLSTVTCQGSVQTGRTANDSVSIHGATRYFVTVLRETLLSEGITVAGEALPIAALGDDMPPLRQSNERLFFHDSPTLTEIVFSTNLTSENLFAEILLKTAGLTVAPQGSFATGGRAALRFLERHDIPTENVTVVDGSGLSRLNQVTVQALAGILRASEKGDWSDCFRDSFPVGASSGSLRNRFAQDNQTREMGRNIQAKTGYIRGVRALSGWATRDDGTVYRFSFLLNSGERNVGNAVTWIDEAALALVR